MARFLDELLREKLPTVVLDQFLRCTVIDAQNVYDYLVQNYPKSEVRPTIDLPNVAPPLREMWIEYRENDPRRTRIGWCLRADDYMLPPDVTAVPDEDGSALDGRWLVTGVEYIEKFGAVARTRTVIGTHGEIRPTLSIENGTATILPYTLDFTPGLTPSPEISAEVAFSMNVILYTLCFMHSKNVMQEQVDPPPKLSHAHEKKYKRPLLSYRVLKIKPMGAPRGQGKPTGEHLAPAMHIRRGHFKTFTEAAPLFGKWTGMYWWEQSVRGDPKRGHVVKEYEPAPDGEA